MAEVDFSNAHIEPWNGVPSLGSTLDSWTKVNSVWQPNATFNMSNALLGDGGGTISTATITQTTSESRKVVFLYSGTFNASGTQFAFGYAVGGIVTAWRIYGISFQSGDTYAFKISANIV